MKTYCPECSADFDVPESALGKTTKCPSCSGKFIITGSVDAAVKINSDERVFSKPKTENVVDKYPRLTLVLWITDVLITVIVGLGFCGIAAHAVVVLYTFGSEALGALLIDLFAAVSLLLAGLIWSAGVELVRVVIDIEKNTRAVA